MTTHDTTALVKQLREALIDARDDVQAELQRCTELAGRPATDRRLAAQVALALDVDIAIADAEKWLAAPQAVAQPLTDEQIIEIRQQTRFGKIGPWADTLAIARAIQRACASAWGVTLADGIGQPAGNRPSTPLHITGPDGRSLRVTRQYWHEGVLCVRTEARPEPRTMTDEDLADCGLLSELDSDDKPCRCGPDGCADSACPGRTA